MKAASFEFLETSATYIIRRGTPVQGRYMQVIGKIDDLRAIFD